METLLSLEKVNQGMGRKRRIRTPCHRARSVDWSMRKRSRVMDATARMPRGAASGKARIRESLLHVLASRVTRSPLRTMMTTGRADRRGSRGPPNRRPSAVGRSLSLASAIARQRPHRTHVSTACRLWKKQIPRRRNHFVVSRGSIS